MKKVTLILAMLMFAGMTVLADWEVSGVAEYKLNVTDGTSSEGSDQDLIINVSKALDETTTISLKYDSDDAEDDSDVDGSIDTEFNLLLNKKINDKVEAQVATVIDTASGANKSGIALKEDNGGDTFVKLSVSDNLTVTVYPFEAGTGLGDELETTNTQDELGFEFDYTVSEGLATVLVLNTFGNSTDEENYLGMKAEATLTSIENLEVVAGLSFSTVEEDVLNADGEAYTALATSVRAAYTMGALTLNGEALYAGSNAKDADAGLAIYAKGAYGLGAMVGFSSTEAYVEATITDEDVYYDGSQDTQTINVGVTGTWNDVYMTPEFSTETIGDADAVNTVSMTIGVEF